MSSVLVFGLLTGCGANTNGGTGETKVDSPKQDEVTANFHTSIETKEEDNTIIVTYKVKNISGKAQKLTFPSGLQADFIVYDEEGNQEKQFSDEVLTTQAIQEIALEKDQEFEEEFTISNLNNGNYVLEVFLTAKEEQAKVKTDLLVVKSLYSMGTGELVGQMDPHTVEINIDGTPTAFQLTEIAQQQYPLLKEGNHVSFIYTKNEFEHKTIEKFVIN